MKKLNKTLTRALIILLTLVLLTSSVVSTTLASYTVTKSAKVEVGLQKFGLQVNLSSDLPKDDSKTVKKGNTVSIVLQKIILTPDDLVTYLNAIDASITGTATVAADVTVSINILDCNDDKFTISSEDFSDYTDSKVYNPIEFFVNAKECETAGDNYDTNSSKNQFETESEKAIGGKIKTELTTGTNITFTSAGSALSTTSSEGSLYQIKGEIAQGATVNNCNLDFGFGWDDSNAGTLANEISTYISDKEPTFTIIYTITVEQAPNP